MTRSNGDSPRRLRIPAALAVTIVGSSASLAIAFSGCGADHRQASDERGLEPVDAAATIDASDDALVEAAPDAAPDARPDAPPDARPDAPADAFVPPPDTPIV